MITFFKTHIEDAMGIDTFVSLEVQSHEKGVCVGCLGQIKSTTHIYVWT
jgi:hypothetical protein